MHLVLLPLQVRDRSAAREMLRPRAADEAAQTAEARRGLRIEEELALDTLLADLAAAG